MHPGQPPDDASESDDTSSTSLRLDSRTRPLLDDVPPLDREAADDTELADEPDERSPDSAGLDEREGRPNRARRAASATLRPLPRTASAKSSSSPTPSSSAARALSPAAAVSASSTDEALPSAPSDVATLTTSDPSSSPRPASMPRRASDNDRRGNGGDDDRRGRLRWRPACPAPCSSSRLAGASSDTGRNSNRCCRGRRRGQLDGAGPPAEDARVRGRPGDGAVATSAGPVTCRVAGGAASAAATGPAAARRLPRRVPPTGADANIRRWPRGGDTSDSVGEMAMTGLPTASPAGGATASMTGPAEDKVGSATPAAPAGGGVADVHGSAADASCAGVAEKPAGEGGRVRGADRRRRRGCRNGDGVAVGAGSAPRVNGAADVGGGGRMPAGQANGRAVSSSVAGR